MKNFRMSVSTVIAVTLLGGFLTGCSPESPAAACIPYPAGVVLAVSAHQNVAAPNLPAGIACRVKQTIAAGFPVGIVAIDGEPWVALSPILFDTEAKNANKRDALIERAFGQVVSGVQALKARTDGSDVFASIMLASDAARSAVPPIGDIIVLDSGAADQGVLTMTAPGMTIAAPAEVATEAVNVSGITNDRLVGQTFTLVSFGNTVAPQLAPSESQRANIPLIWQATLQAFGATVEIDATPRQGKGPDTALTTGTFEISNNVIELPVGEELIVFDGGSALAFEHDTADLRHHDAAYTALTPLAEWLKESPGRTASITGTTGSPTPELNGPLSLDRAETVKKILVDELGVPPEMILTEGAGYIASPDDHPSGVVVPGLAALNMTVRIQTHTAG